MNTDIKKYCKIHNFYYIGDKCPFCSVDRMNELFDKYDNDKQ